MARILVVEDSQDIITAVEAVLKSEHGLVSVPTLRQAAEFLELHEFDLVLLDIDLPDGDGVEFLSRMAQSLEEKQIGVILLTGTNTVSTRTRSFSLGALDFIAKPFDLEEFHVRVNAKLKARLRGFDEALLNAHHVKAGQIEIDLTRQQVFQVGVGGERRQIDLTPVEFRLLLLFVQNKGQVVPRAQILQTVWGQAHVSSRSVDHHVCGLRKKIQNAGGKIESIYGVGYRIDDAA